MKIQARLKGAAAPIALSVALLSQPAFAQDDTTPVQTVGADDLARADVDTDEGEAIVVTGSRIRRTEASSASPLQIIDPEISRKAGLNDTAAIIQNSPIASGSSQINSAISVNAQGVNGGPGAQTISLRGLGAERTLVLLNSRRAGPAGTRGGVSSFDLGVLPASIIKSVEILKDGASSIYGSDAIAGVVNIITKTDTDGLELDGFTSIPLEKGGEEYTVSAAWGKDFGRGHILLAGEYYHQNVLRRSDRKYLDCTYDYLFRSEDSDERVDLVDPRYGTPHCDGAPWGHIWAYSSATRGRNLPDPGGVTLIQYDYPGDNLGQFVPPIPTATLPGDLIAPAGWYPVSYQTTAANSVVNDYSPWERKASVIPKTNRFTAYLDGSFEVTDKVKVYAEGLFNRRETYVDYYSQFYNFGRTDQYADNDPDNPFPGWHGLDGRYVTLSPTGILDNYDQQINVDYYRGVVGASGDITDHLSFDVHGQWSKSDGKYYLDQILNDVIYQQTDRSFGYGCAGRVSPISGRDCLQVNWVDPRVMAGNLTDEEENYFTETEMGRTKYTQKFVEASVSGDLIQLPAGRLGFAFGAVVREDKIDDLPGHITYADNITCDEQAISGEPLAYPCYDPSLPEDPIDNPSHIDNGFANNFSSGHTFGKSTTKEVFGEIEIPIFKDKPFARDFTLSAAGRLTNVKAVRGQDGFSDSSNGNFTYKLMANWQINDWIRLRSTYGTSYRAPALFEQFLSGQVTGFQQYQVDPCVQWQQGLDEGTISNRVATNCAADGIDPLHTGAGIAAKVFSSGGIGLLEPETSKAWTASVILTPQLGPDTKVDLTIDYFNIKVSNEISQLSGYQILYNCYDAVDFPNSDYCDSFERGQDGDPQNVKLIRKNFINIEEQINRGFDFTLRASHNMGNAGTLSLLGQATLQTKDTITQLGDFDDLNGEVGDPKFTATVNLTWDVNDWTLYYGLEVIGKSSTAKQYTTDFGGLCQTTGDFIPVYGGQYCVRPYTPTVVYHTVSLTKTLWNRFDITAGMANVFNTRPPEVSGLSTLGSSPFVSQYDWLGRRLFVNLGAKF